MRRVWIALAVALAVSGCEYRGAASLPLPGGVGSDGYTVTMVFDDATNLVPQETCRAGDVVVGSVESIILRSDLKAKVVCRIKPDVRLPANAVPTLRETSLLGERFVALDPPAGDRAEGVMAHGAALTDTDAHVVPDAEVVLSALSGVLNGGGLDNVETISRELSIGLSGSDLGATTRTVHRLVRVLNEHRQDIVNALDGLDRLAGELSRQRGAIASALDSVPAGLAVLDDERPRLVEALVELGELSDEATPFLKRTRADTTADFRHLARILKDLSRTKDDRLARALEALLTFPFPSYTKYVTRYDYAGMYGTYALDLDSFNALFAQQEAARAADSPEQPTAAAPSGAPSLPDVLKTLPLPLPQVAVPDVPLPDPAGIAQMVGDLVKNVSQP